MAWPKVRSDDAKTLIRRSLLRDGPQCPRFITPRTRFAALGSCFALNLAARLRETGHAVFAELIVEDANNTYANRYLLEWVEHGATTPETEMMEAAYGPVTRETFRNSFAQTDAFIFTLGLAPTYFRREDGSFFFINGRTLQTQGFTHSVCAMRTTTVAENADNIRRIAASLKRLGAPDARTFFTVSPAPLAATSEMASAVMADCVSKSTLRAACHEALADGTTGAVYWPSFEMVRWLDPLYAAGDAYAANTRHVSDWLVKDIVELFLETYSASEPS